MPATVRLLRRLGVMRHFLRQAVPLEWGWEFRRWQNGAVLSVERLAGACEHLYGGQVEESWSATATVEEFFAEFAGWDSRVTELIRAAETPAALAICLAAEPGDPERALKRYKSVRIDPAPQEATRHGSRNRPNGHTGGLARGAIAVVRSHRHGSDDSTDGEPV